jgi:hypothetical protein
MIIALLAGIIPAIFLVEIGRSWRPIQDKPESFPGWAGFLSVGLGLLLGTAVLAFRVFGESGSLPAMILLPSICALFAESCLYLFKILISLISGQARPYLRWPAGLLLVTPFLLAALGFLGDTFILQFVLFGGALLASGWLVWNRLGRQLALSYLPLLFLLLLAVLAIDTQTEFQFLPANLASMARNLLWLAPGLGIILACRLLGWALADEPVSKARKLFLTGLLIVPILLLLAWQAATASAWDVATDGLGGIFMLQLSYVFGVAAAVHQSWNLPLKRNVFVFGFVPLILVIVMGANSFGTYGFDGEWGNVPHARTARRAAMINQALLRYYEQQGQYPQALADLTPGYLVYLPTPFIIPHQDWCYQSGPGYYRLGYVYRDYFSTPATVKVFAAAGQPPDLSWSCDAEAAKYPAPSGYNP